MFYSLSCPPPFSTRTDFTNKTLSSRNHHHTYHRLTYLYLLVLLRTCPKIPSFIIHDCRSQHACNTNCHFFNHLPCYLSCFRRPPHLSPQQRRHMRTKYYSQSHHSSLCSVFSYAIFAMSIKTFGVEFRYSRSRTRVLPSPPLAGLKILIPLQPSFYYYTWCFAIEHGLCCCWNKNCWTSNCWLLQHPTVLFFALIWWMACQHVCRKYLPEGITIAFFCWHIKENAVCCVTWSATGREAC